MNGYFVPLVFSSDGGIVPATKLVIHSLASRLCQSTLDRLEDVKEETNTTYVSPCLNQALLDCDVRKMIA